MEDANRYRGCPLRPQQCLRKYRSAPDCLDLAGPSGRQCLLRNPSALLLRHRIQRAPPGRNLQRNPAEPLQPSKHYLEARALTFVRSRCATVTFPRSSVPQCYVLQQSLPRSNQLRRSRPRKFCGPIRQRQQIPGPRRRIQPAIQIDFESAADHCVYLHLHTDPRQSSAHRHTIQSRPAASALLSYLGSRWGANVGASFVGPRPDDDFFGFNITHAAGYVRADVGGWYAINSRVTTYANVENALDRRYNEVVGYPALPINIRAGVRFRLGGEERARVGTLACYAVSSVDDECNNQM